MALKVKNVVIGCAVGCGVIVLLAVGSCVGFMTWLGRPGELLDASRLVDRDTTGYAEWTLSLDDPGVQPMVDQLLRAFQEMQRQGSGSDELNFVQGWLQQNQAKSTRRDIEQLFPLMIAWNAWSGDDSAEPLSAVSISIEKMGNRMVLADWAMGWALGRSPEELVQRHDGEKIYSFPDHEAAFFLRSSDVFIAADPQTARRIVDRLADPATVAPADTDLVRLLATLPDDRPLRGAVANRNGETAWAMDWLLPDGTASGLDWSRVGGVTLAGGFREDRALVAALTLVGTSSWSDDEHQVLQQVLIDSLAGEYLRVEPLPREDRSRIAVELRVDDAAESIRRWLERTTRSVIDEAEAAAQAP